MAVELMTRTGEYRTYGYWYKDTHAPDATSGEMVTSYALVGPDYIALEWESGKLFEAAKQLNSEIQGLGRAHYRSDVKPSWRFKIGRRWIQATYVSDYKEQHRELWIGFKEALD